MTTFATNKNMSQKLFRTVKVKNVKKFVHIRQIARSNPPSKALLYLLHLPLVVHFVNQKWRTFMHRFPVL
jgi:hypothetical protein